MTGNGIRRMFQHMEWADRRLLEEAMPAEALRLFAHVLAAERVWLLRMRGVGGEGQAIWPAMEVEELARLAEANHAGYGEMMRGMSESEMGRMVEYRNQSGRSYRNSLRDILIHVAMHGAYHRGQIAARVRESGGEPVNTDYIVFVREHARESV